MRMQALKRKVRFNWHDYQSLPAEKRYEIIDGDLHMVPAPLTTHQIISRNLADMLWEHISKRKLGELLYAPVDVIFSFEDIVQPDIVFISKERLDILKKENVQGAPDLVIEILSPSTQTTDKEIKLKLYEKYGIREYWIVDPEARSIEVRQLTDDGLKLIRAYPKGTHLKSPLLSELSLPVEEVFA